MCSLDAESHSAQSYRYTVDIHTPTARRVKESVYYAIISFTDRHAIAAVFGLVGTVALRASRAFESLIGARRWVPVVRR